MGPVIASLVACALALTLLAVSVELAKDGLPSAETLAAIGSILTGSGAVGAALVALRGLGVWRSEATGRRRSAVAEEILADFYMAEDIIHNARAPFFQAHELVPRKGEDRALAKKPAFAVARRLSKHELFFTKLRVKKHKFSAVFGVENSRSFDALGRVMVEINVSIDQLLRYDDDPCNRQGMRDFLEEQRSIAFRPALREDKISAKVRELVTEIEAVCRPHILTWPKAK